MFGYGAALERLEEQDGLHTADVKALCGENLTNRRVILPAQQPLYLEKIKYY